MAFRSPTLISQGWAQSHLRTSISPCSEVNLGNSWINLKTCFPQSFLWVLLSLMLWPLWALPSIVLLFMFCTWVSLQSSKAGFARSKRLQLSCAVHQNSHWNGSCKCAVLGDVTLLVQEGRHHCDTVIFLVGQGTKHTHGTQQTGMNLCPNTELSFQSWLTITDIKKEQLIPQNWYTSIFSLLTCTQLNQIILCPVKLLSQKHTGCSLSYQFFPYALWTFENAGWIIALLIKTQHK